MLFASTPLPSRSSRKAEKKRRKRPVLRFVLLLLIISVLLGAGYVYFKFDRMLDDVSSGVTEPLPEEELAESKPLTMLLLGLDSRPQTGTRNTDVIMVVSMNPQKKSATVVSVPRDTYVKVDGYKARKANQFYAVTDHVKDVFSAFLDIPIDYVTVVNFDSFTQLVDLLGGIEIDVDMDMRYVDPTDGTDINLKQGLQTLDGKQALDFVRYRLGNPGGTPSSSDLQRNQRQQQAVAALIDRIGFFTFLKIGSIFDTFGEHIQTDIPKEQLKSIISTYMTISNEHIEYISIQGQWKSPFVYLNEDSFEQARISLLSQLE